MKENFNILGRRVKYMRMDKGISQMNMAAMLGLSQTNLSNMESGRTAITTQNLFKIREIMGCRMADFFVDFDEKIAQDANASEAIATKQAIELEDAVKILKLLKAVDVKGL
ncbi:MAG: helix-turn-helix transcriptional regulator [Phascolarctobacterium sp.]|nr:helix-turn-helix transcriptional regulator [Phascolarctobacterium sp.]